MNRYLQIIVLAFVFSYSIPGFAQKLPNEQEKSVWAAASVKVDGKIVSDAFAAANKATQISYTLSNNDRNLYLVLKSDDQTNVSKILMGGITLTINTDGRKREKDGFSITYPVIVRQQRAQAGGGQRQGQMRQGQSEQRTGSRSQTSSPASDSIANARRSQQLAAMKEIKVLGFKDVADSLLSIYNEYNMMAAATVDERGAYLYELAIPLKMLNLSADGRKIAYNIKINGRQINANIANFQGMEGGGRQRGRDSGSGFDPSRFLPVDFWGEYSIAKPVK
jgi:hypothetical protein